VLVGQDVNIHAGLEPQTSTSSIQVLDAAPVVEDKIDVSQNVTQAQIDNLPINGRRVDSFVLLTPTVVPDGAFGHRVFQVLSSAYSAEYGRATGGVVNTVTPMPGARRPVSVSNSS